MFTQKNLYHSSFWGASFIILEACLGGCAQHDPSSGKPSSGNSSPSVEVLVDILNKGDCVAKLDAMDELGKLGAKAKPAVPILMRILEDDKTPIPGVDIAVKRKRLRRPEDANAALRSSAASVLGEIGPDAYPAVPVLLATLETKNPGLRMNSAQALADIGVKDARTLSALKRMLDDADSDIQIEAAKALSELDPKSEEAISTLTKALRQNNLSIWWCYICG